MKTKRKGKLRKGRIFVCFIGILITGTVFTTAVREIFSVLQAMVRQAEDDKSSERTDSNTKIEKVIRSFDEKDYPEELIELYRNNQETEEFVAGYPENKNKNFKIDLSKEAEADDIPLLLQWDKRWGYQEYGSNMIALTGCGPTCLSMVYIGLTGDASLHPGKMAEFSEKNGFYAEGGTSWSFMTEGAQKLGLSSLELPLDENRMKRELSDKKPIICSMRAGDFTAKGHFIVLTGIDENGSFVLNDPNSRKNSETAWSYERLSTQIKNLWAFEYATDIDGK